MSAFNYIAAGIVMPLYANKSTYILVAGARSISVLRSCNYVSVTMFILSEELPFLFVEALGLYEMIFVI